MKKINVTATIDLDGLNGQDPDEPFTHEQAVEWILMNILDSKPALAFGSTGRFGHMFSAPLDSLTVELEET